MPQYAILTALLAVVLFVSVAARTASRLATRHDPVSITRRAFVGSGDGEMAVIKADMLIVFTTSWCGPCQEYKKIIRKTGLRYRDWEGKPGGADVWFVDAEKYPDLANRHKVSSVPSTITVKSGCVVDVRSRWSESELKELFK
jgi:thioredoxin-like negative regulator of GroEL